MKFKLSLIDQPSEITKKILGALEIEVSSIINKAIPKITEDIKYMVADALRQEPEYSSLLGGTLRAEFGIPDPSSVEKVVEALINTISVKSEKIIIAGNGLKGGFSLTMMKSDDMGGVIYLDSASVVDSQKGYTLPWLEWLLYENNRPIVKRYSVEYTSSPYSRSGLAVMVPDSSNWRVPPEFAGSTKNNWTTRAISRIENTIYSTIINDIKDVL
jgi:hypothetical protein